jgi:hypothetical protein
MTAIDGTVRKGRPRAVHPFHVVPFGTRIEWFKNRRVGMSTMARVYHVTIRDSNTNEKILTFKGNVVRKEQESGRISGDVEETLYVDEYEIKKHKIKR